MNDKLTIDQKLVFAVAPLPEGPALLIGIPLGAWEYMKDGKTHNLDLTSIGVPLKLMLYGGKDHTECLNVIEQACRKHGITIDDQRRKDFNIHPKQEG